MLSQFVLNIFKTFITILITAFVIANFLGIVLIVGIFSLFFVYNITGSHEYLKAFYDFLILAALISVITEILKKYNY